VEILRTERLVLRTWTKDDLKTAQQLWGDPAVTALISDAPLTLEEAADLLDQQIADQSEHGVQYWLCSEVATGEPVGAVGLRPCNHLEAPFELGFHLLADQQGRGFAFEAASAVVRYGLDHLGAGALFAGHHPDNHASAHLLARLGFEPAGELRYPGTGLMHPSYVLHDGRLDADPGWTPLEAAHPYLAGDPFVGHLGPRRRFRVRWYEDADGVMVGKAWFGPGCEGPPGHVHGGAITTILDQAMGGGVWRSGHPALAGGLEVRFRSMAPLGLLARCRMVIESIDGRKIRARAELTDMTDGRLIAEATGLFVSIDPATVGV